MQSGMIRRIAALLQWKQSVVLSRRDQTVARPDERVASKERIGAYPRRWLGWAGTLIICVALILLTAGCAYLMATGNESILSKENTAQIKIGEWTKVDVRRILGEPSSILYVAGDEEVWFYVYMGGKIVMVGEDTSRDMAAFSIRFTREGIVKEKGYGRYRL